MKFSEWITKKFLEWQAECGERKTIEEYAAYVGVSRALMNLWMNGNKARPGTANIKLLAEIYGDEIYDVLDLPRPDPDLQTITKIWYQLPEPARRALREQAEQYITQDDQWQKLTPPQAQPSPSTKTASKSK